MKRRCFAIGCGVILRYSTADDCEYLRDLRNDPVARMMSRNDQPITVGQHYVWFMTTTDTILIAEVNEEAVGSIRLIHHPHEVELGIIVDPKHRGKGYAPEMLRLAAEYTSDHLVAYVRTDNEPSLRAFTRAGWVKGQPYVRFEQ